MALRLIGTTLSVALTAILVGGESARAASPKHFKAVAFDYFVIFNPNSVAEEAEKKFPGKGMELTKIWRTKQFEYGFLRTITGKHKDFFSVTKDALNYALEATGLQISEAEKQILVKAYLKMKPWPDAKAALEKLRANGIKIITIANFSHKMLKANADNAGITPLFDELLSTEVNKTYKPDPKAYRLGLERLGLKKSEVVFAAFGGWDAYGAKEFGYTTIWINRFGLPTEQLDNPPAHQSRDLAGLLDLVIRR